MQRKTIDIRTGEGLLDVKGNGLDCMLIYHGKPVAMAWCDCEGSVGQYLSNTTLDNTQIEKALSSVRRITENGLTDPHSIEVLVEIFSNIFADGQYELDFPVEYESLSVLNFCDRSSFYAYYPHETLIALQSTLSLDLQRIAWYEQEIEYGVRPLIIALSISDNFNEFIVDGHHKAMAYANVQRRRKGIGAKILFFRKIPAQEIPVEEGVSAIERLDKRLKEKYISVKRDYGNHK